MLYDEARMALTKERLEDLRKEKSCPLNSFPSSLRSVVSTSAIQIFPATLIPLKPRKHGISTLPCLGVSLTTKLTFWHLIGPRFRSCGEACSRRMKRPIHNLLPKMSRRPLKETTMCRRLLPLTRLRSLILTHI